MKMQADLRTFFEVASPTTLAELINDIQDCVFENADHPAFKLEEMAMKLLFDNVGGVEAEELLDWVKRCA